MGYYVEFAITLELNVLLTSSVTSSNRDTDAELEGTDAEL